MWPQRPVRAGVRAFGRRKTAGHSWCAADQREPRRKERWPGEHCAAGGEAGGDAGSARVRMHATACTVWRSDGRHGSGAPLGPESERYAPTTRIRASNGPWLHRVEVSLWPPHGCSAALCRSINAYCCMRSSPNLDSDVVCFASAIGETQKLWLRCFAPQAVDRSATHTGRAVPQCRPGSAVLPLWPFHSHQRTTHPDVCPPARLHALHHPML